MPGLLTVLVRWNPSWRVLVNAIKVTQKASKLVSVTLRDGSKAASP